jgi:hypothetical protein
MGLSIHGPKDRHDRFRVGKGSAPTFEQVYRAARLFRHFPVTFLDLRLNAGIHGSNSCNGLSSPLKPQTGRLQSSKSCLAKRAPAALVRSTLRAVPARGSGPLFVKGQLASSPAQFSDQGHPCPTYPSPRTSRSRLRLPLQEGSP